MNTEEENRRLKAVQDERNLVPFAEQVFLALCSDPNCNDPETRCWMLARRFRTIAKAREEALRKGESLRELMESFGG